jgi:hypothetical protein
VTSFPTDEFFSGFQVNPPEACFSTISNRIEE